MKEKCVPHVPVRLLIVIAGIVSLTLGAGMRAEASVSCERIKIRAAGLLARCQLGEFARAGATGLEPNFDRCGEALGRLFVRAEERSGGACPTSGDATQVISDVSEMTTELVARLSGNGVCNQGEHEVCEACQCVPIEPCNDVQCLPHQQCRIYDTTGEAYCADTCDGFSCPNGQHCELQEVTCVRAPCPPVAACVEDGPVCSLPPETGDCDAAIPRWYHNAQSGQCEPFIYGGCGGNGNNFETKDDCEAACN